MARRRLQQNGNLYQQGGWWKLRWREDHVAEDGNIKRGWSKPAWIGPCDGVGKLSEKQAKRIAWENFLAKLDQNTRTPMSVMTVQEFVNRKFIPEHVDQLKPAGKEHYETMLKLVMPHLGTARLRDVTSDDVHQVVSKIRRSRYPVYGKLDRTTGDRTIRGYRPYSGQTAMHVRNVISAIFRLAKAKQWYAGENPASLVSIKHIERKERHALTIDQARTLLRALPVPTRDIALFAILTSMNIAEICGLKWRYVNLSDQWQTVDGEALQPWSIAVRWQWRRGAYGSVKTGTRKRDLPIPVSLAPVLASYKTATSGPDDPVFAGRTGRPIDAHNECTRKLKPIGKGIGMPWLSWHVFRRAHTTIAKQLGMDLSDRIASMGHADARMTMLYTAEDLDRRRKTLDSMAEQLMRVEGKIQ